jgi:hypothetical protein
VNTQEGWYIDDILVRGVRDADIDLDPWEIRETLLPESTAQVPLTVFNKGAEQLNFSVEVTSGSSWLNVSPQNGSLGPNSSTQLSVELDATGAFVGIHDGSIEITSNDPDEPWLVVPVQLEVIEGLCGDSDGSGTVTPSDGYWILNYMGGGDPPSSCWAANVNGDDGITPGDGFSLLNYMGSGPGLNCAPCELRGASGKIVRPKRDLQRTRTNVDREQ